MTSEQLTAWVNDARQRTCQLVADLADDQLFGPHLPIANPLLWEIGHVAWFQEKWVLRHAARQKPIRDDADALYDSATVPHDVRWDLPLPGREETLRYLDQVRAGVLERLQGRNPTQEEAYFILLSVFHEDMHAEASLYTRQTLGWRAPRRAVSHPEDGRGFREKSSGAQSEDGVVRGDAEVPAGTFWLGAAHEEPFVFDNEKWAHPVGIAPFAIARATVTQAEFAEFTEAGGYRARHFWSETGWRWREETGAEQPVYWRRETGGRWLRRDFDRWVPLESKRPMVHVNWYEAEAFCRWAGRRLPTEAEWEAAAAGQPESVGRLAACKRRYPWGDVPPTARHANLGADAFGCVAVDALPSGDSGFGCRQMIGNVWEWTASDFLPYPGFVVDPYKEYSAPWFGTHKVLRGGCWATQARLLRNTWRNFYTPDRRDVWAGFRTCALHR